MSENKELVQDKNLSQEDLALRASYILKFLNIHLNEVKIKSRSRLYNSGILMDLLAPTFNDKRGNARFNIGTNSFVVERSDELEYLEVSFTRFEQPESQIVSEGFKLRVKRLGSNSENHIEYHIRNKAEHKSLVLRDTKFAVSRSIDFISSIV